MFSRLVRYYILVIVLLFGCIFTADFFYQKSIQEKMPTPETVTTLIRLAKVFCLSNECEEGVWTPVQGMKVLSLDALAFPVNEMEKLALDGVVVVHDEQFQYYFARLNDTQALEIGPYSIHSHTVSHWYSFTFYFFLGLAFLLILFPLYRDIWRIKAASERFAFTRELSNLEIPESRFFKPVTDTISWMMLKIARLIALQNELSSTLSHELRTNVSRLKFTVAGLNADNVVQSKQQLKEDIREIQTLVDQYLNFAKQEHEKPELDISPVSLGSTINTYLEQLGTYTQKKYSFTMLADPLILADLAFLSRAIKNLIDNAFKYAEQEICVSLKREDNSLLLIIEDDGAGVPSDKIEELFLPYTRNHNEQLGYGLGLAITKKVVNWHEGEVSVSKSFALGGASFQLRLPLIY
jgi:signal transduction histidine kinase